jgi:hypothetical protein
MTSSFINGGLERRGAERAAWLDRDKHTGGKTIKKKGKKNINPKNSKKKGKSSKLKLKIKSTNTAQQK